MCRKKNHKKSYIKYSHTRYEKRHIKKESTYKTIPFEETSKYEKNPIKKPAFTQRDPQKRPVKETRRIWISQIKGGEEDT